MRMQDMASSCLAEHMVHSVAAARLEALGNPPADVLLLQRMGPPGLQPPAPAARPCLQCPCQMTWYCESRMPVIVAPQLGQHSLQGASCPAPRAGMHGMQAPPGQPVGTVAQGHGFTQNHTIEQPSRAAGLCSHRAVLSEVWSVHGCCCAAHATSWTGTVYGQCGRCTLARLALTPCSLQCLRATATTSFKMASILLLYSHM